MCPAEFRVGEDARAMVSSVTEGEDKPMKYPLMFRACELVLINKIDLLEHLDFDLDRFLYHLDAVDPGVQRMLMSARTGEGVDAWREWLTAKARTGAAAGAARAEALAADRVGELLARRTERTRRSSRPRPTASLGCATRWPSGSRAAVASSPSARRRPRGRTPGTSPSSSSIR